MGIKGFWFGLSLGQAALLCLLGFIHSTSKVLAKYGSIPYAEADSENQKEL